MTQRDVPRLMRIWLDANHNGRLTYDQWLSLVTQPLLTVILISVPVLVIFGFAPVGTVQMVRVARFGGFLFLLVPLGIVGMLVFRGFRYSFVRVFGEVLYAGHETGPGIRLRRNLTLYTESGQSVQFEGILPRYPNLEADAPYIVYFIEMAERRILISYAPAEHPDAPQWQPLP